MPPRTHLQSPRSKVAWASSLYRVTNRLCFCVQLIRSHRTRKERGPTAVDARYRLEAYATLLFGLAREYGNHPAEGL
jgi:hypothetical protein